MKGILCMDQIKDLEVYHIATTLPCDLALSKYAFIAILIFCAFFVLAFPTSVDFDLLSELV